MVRPINHGTLHAPQLSFQIAESRCDGHFIKSPYSFRLVLIAFITLSGNMFRLRLNAIADRVFTL